MVSRRERDGFQSETCIRFWVVGEFRLRLMRKPRVEGMIGVLERGEKSNQEHGITFTQEKRKITLTLSKFIISHNSAESVGEITPRSFGVPELCNLVGTRVSPFSPCIFSR